MARFLPSTWLIRPTCLSFHRIFAIGETDSTTHFMMKAREKFISQSKLWISRLVNFQQKVMKIAYILAKQCSQYFFQFGEFLRRKNIENA